MNEETKYYHTVHKLKNSSKVFKEISEEEFEKILIFGGKTFLDKIIERRNPDTLQERKDELKLQLPGICFQARFKDGKRNQYHISELTGEILIEEDGTEFDADGEIIKFATAEEARTKRNEVLSEHWKVIKYAYDSASLRNHYVVRVSGLTISNFKAACKYAAKLLGIVIDPQGIHVSRLAAFSYDPSPYINKTDSDCIDVSVVQEKEKSKVLINASVAKTNLRAEGKHKFFTHSLADVHLSEFIQTNLENVIYYPEGYLICVNKLPMLKLMGRRIHIVDGERNEALFRDFSLYVSLNGCNQTNEQLWKGFIAYQRKWCYHPLPESELETIFNKVMVRFFSGNLSIGAIEQNGAWYSWCRLSTTEKKALSSQAKKHRNIILFLDALTKLKIGEEEKKKRSVCELAFKLDMPKQTIYNYQEFIQSVLPQGAKNKNDICDELKRRAFVKNDISSLTIYNIILYYIGEVGLYDFGILLPTMTVGEVIKEFQGIGAKITKKTIANELGCSVDTVKRSKDWKDYQRMLNEPRIENRLLVPAEKELVPAHVSNTLMQITHELIPVAKSAFDFRRTRWFLNLSEADKFYTETEISNGRNVAEVMMEVVKGDLVLFSNDA